jgi:hypothetical protein
MQKINNVLLIGICVLLFNATETHACDELAYGMCAIAIDTNMTDGAMLECDKVERYHIELEKCMADSDCCEDKHSEIKDSTEAPILAMCPRLAEIIENCDDNDEVLNPSSSSSGNDDGKNSSSSSSTRVNSHFARYETWAPYAFMAGLALF